MANRLSLRAALAALLVFLLLTGCARQEPGAASPPEATLPPETVPPTTLPQVLEFLPDREPEDDQLVKVSDYIPGIYQELPYATENNFTGETIYSFSHAYLRYGTVKKLAQVQSALEDRGLSLKIWDGFRPVSAQWKLWEICPDPAYVCDPTKGYSSHSRGNTVDITLVDLLGNAQEMPTGFDDFPPLADRDYSDCPETAAENARFLEETMKKYGFTGYFMEWWHFSDTESYDVAEAFCPREPQPQAVTSESPFLSGPSWEAEILAWIIPGEAVTLHAQDGDFFLVSYKGTWGYVPGRHLDSSAHTA